MGRANLGFIEATQSAFSFLVQDWGFRLVKLAAPTFLRYESKEMFLNIYHGRQSYELNVEIGLIDDPFGRSYHLSDVLGALVDFHDVRKTYFQASNRPALLECIQAIAALVAEHYYDALRGDRRTLERVEQHRAATAHALENDAVQRRVQKAAEEAWASKNYAKVQELYGSIGDDLTQSERKRLDYARKRC